MKTKRILKKVTCYVLTATVLLAFITAIIVGIDKQEEVECYKLQEQAKEYKGFFITRYEKRMCDYQEIPVDAPVHW